MSRFIFRIAKTVSQLNCSHLIIAPVRYHSELIHKAKSVNLSHALCMTHFQASCLHVSPHTLKKGKVSKQTKMKVLVRPADVEDVVNLFDVQKQLQGYIQKLQEDFMNDYRIGSDLAVFEKIPVVVDNEQVTLSDVAQVVKESPRLVVVDMVAYPELIKQVITAIHASNLSVNPAADGSLIKIQVSQATTEYRKQVASKAEKRAKACKSEMRQYIANEIKSLRNLEISEDMKNVVTEQITIYLDYYLPQVDKVFKAKEATLLTP